MKTNQHNLNFENPSNSPSNYPNSVIYEYPALARQ